ncbi:Epsin-3 [Ranunculus cassubicifolius]
MVSSIRGTPTLFCWFDLFVFSILYLPFEIGRQLSIFLFARLGFVKRRRNRLRPRVQRRRGLYRRRRNCVETPLLKLEARVLGRIWIYKECVRSRRKLDLGTSGRGGLGMFIGICIASAAFGVADAHVQGGMVGDLSFMSPDFVQSFLAGMATSGALTSVLRFVTKAAFENSKDGLGNGALMFLSISTFFEFLCILLYAYVFPKFPIVKYYRSKATCEGSKTVSADLAAGGIQTEPSNVDEEDFKKMERLSTKELFIQNIDYEIDLFLIYVLTLSIFPGFLAEDTGKHSMGSWYAIVLIASYNVLDLVGRYISVINSLKLESQKGLMIAIISRFLLIPAFYFTAKYGDQGYMIMLTAILGLSNGYLTVCIFTVAPKNYKGPEQNALRNLLVLCVLVGLFSGVLLDWMWLIGKGW